MRKNTSLFAFYCIILLGVMLSIGGVNAEVWNQTIVRNLQAHWNMSNFSSNIPNLHNGYHNLTISESTSYLVGVIGDAQKLGGSAGVKIQSNNATIGNFGTGNFTLSFWINLTDTGTDQYPITKGEDSGGGWAIRVVSNTLKFKWNGDGGDRLTGTFTLGNWQHIVIRRIGGEMKMFINAAGGTPYTSSVDLTRSTPLTFGYSYNDPTKIPNVVIDEVSVWNRGLSDAEITALYNGGSGAKFDEIPDVTPPGINISLPRNNYNYGYVGQNITINYSISDPNINECTFEYENINRTINCYQNSTTFILNKTRYLNVWANDLNLNLAKNTTSWNFTIFENSRSYSNSVSTTSQTDFAINSTFGSYSSISSILIYNNTPYVSTINGDGGDRITGTFTLGNW